jgi:Fe-S-cluster containining protein
MIIQGNGHNLATEEILEGFIYSYHQIDTNALKVYEASAQIYSLIELLVAKGIIGIEELDKRKNVVEKRLKDSFEEAEIGVRIQNDGVDKYNLKKEVKIDCEARKPLCLGACCTLAFALSPQDIREGIRWSLGKPFMNVRGEDGYCVNMERGELRCSIYEHRPSVCRLYDCRNDHRIWQDFDKMIINPALIEGGKIVTPIRTTEEQQNSQ